MRETVVHSGSETEAMRNEIKMIGELFISLHRWSIS